jgi:phosphoglucosamine mutase
MINVEIETKLGIQRLELIQSEVVKKALDEAEAELNSRGRIVLRPSGTEPLIRVMVEGESKEMIDRVAKAIADNVAQAARLGAP